MASVCAPASGAGLLEKNFWLSGPRYDAVVPACEDPAALGKIQARFSEKESRFWNSSLQIVHFERVREIAFRPWAVDALKRRVNYSIIEDGGMIGGTWGVEWCVLGLDRNWAYNPHCRMALP